MTKKRQGIGYHDARAQLGLTVWQMKLALEYRLLTRHEDGSLNAKQVTAALDDLEGFRARLDDLEPLNLTQGAAELEVSKDRLRRVIRQVGLEPAQTDTVRMYGRSVEVHRWRRADLRALAPHLAADIELRAAAAAVARSAAAKKAAKTRAANALARQQATESIWFAAMSPDPLAILALSAGWHMHQGISPTSSLVARARPDEAVVRWAQTLEWACLSPTDRERLDITLAERMEAVAGDLADGGRRADEVGVPWTVLAKHLPHVGFVTTRKALDQLEGGALGVIVGQYRARLEAEELAAALRRAEQGHLEQVRERAHQQASVLDQAHRAVARLSAAAVAEIFGLPEAPVAAIKKTWTAAHVAQLRRDTPWWLASPEGAARYAAERAQRREQKNRKKRAREKHWHTQWAKALGVPVSRLPSRYTQSNPTPRAVQAVLRDRPGWLVQLWQDTGTGPPGQS